MKTEVLNFWFNEIDQNQWWVKQPEFDQLIRERFGDIHASANACELYRWRESPEGRLAEIIVLDQFSRNIFRDTPAAFASDTLALTLAQEAIAAGDDMLLNEVERLFLYMPLMHSESPKITNWQWNYLEKTVLKQISILKFATETSLKDSVGTLIVIASWGALQQRRKLHF